MNSSTKNRLTANQIHDLVQHSFGMPVKEFVENNIGEFSSIYIVKLEDKKVVLKIAPKDECRILRYEKYAMRAEVEALTLVKENTNVVVPQVLFYDKTKTRCDGEYFFMEKISGRNFNALSSELSEEKNGDILYQIGRLNRQINRIENKTFGYLAQKDKQFGSWKKAFGSIASDILSDGKEADIKLPLAYGKIENIFSSFLYACDDVKTAKLIHWDLWQGNVLVKNEVITGIIDFERALWGDPLMEYFFRKHAHSRRFFDGYSLNVEELDKNAKIRSALYDLYLALIWVIEYHYRDYNDLLGYTWREEQLIKAYNAFEHLD